VLRMNPPPPCSCTLAVAGLMHLAQLQDGVWPRAQ
jgi:hypothetical protein